MLTERHLQSFQQNASILNANCLWGPELLSGKRSNRNKIMMRITLENNNNNNISTSEGELITRLYLVPRPRPRPRPRLVELHFRPPCLYRNLPEANALPSASRFSLQWLRRWLSSGMLHSQKSVNTSHTTRCRIGKCPCIFLTPQCKCSQISIWMNRSGKIQLLFCISEDEQCRRQKCLPLPLCALNNTYCVTQFNKNTVRKV